MEIVFLGTTGYHPNNRRHTASVMFPELGLVFDAGTGIFRARNLLQTPWLHIFLSHVHLDHSVGLTFLFDIAFEKELKTTVFSEAEKADSLEKHLFQPLLFPAALPMEFCLLPPEPSDRVLLESNGDFEVATTSGQVQGDTTEVRYFPLKHPGGSLGYVIQQAGKKVAYITDTTASLDEPYLDEIRGVDLLIHECYFPDGFEEKAKLTGHSCATPVAQVAKECEVGELVLVHVNPLDESDDPIGLPGMKSIFPNVRIAEDNEVVKL